MALCNREKDASEQKEILNWRGHTQINSGYSSILGIVPYPCVIQSARAFAVGNSQSIVSFVAQRFAGGNTAIALGISGIVLNNFGTSGMLGFSGLAATGSTLLQLQAGDVVGFQVSGSGAVSDLALQVVLKKTQDIVSYHGVAT